MTSFVVGALEFTPQGSARGRVGLRTFPRVQQQVFATPRSHGERVQDAFHGVLPHC